MNFYKILLPYLPWFTFIFGLFHLIDDLGRQSGFGQLWNVGLFIALLSQQYCQRKGAFKFHFLLSNYNLNSDISNLLKTLFNHSPVQLTRCRQLLNQIFDYAEDETYIRPNQNPVLKKFQWETGNQRKISDKTFAHTITKNSWGVLPEFLQSVNKNACNGSFITDLATKAHLLMCIRTGVISSLEWYWYDPQEDIWIIPSQTSGLKRKNLMKKMTI